MASEETISAPPESAILTEPEPVVPEPVAPEPADPELTDPEPADPVLPEPTQAAVAPKTVAPKTAAPAVAAPVPPAPKAPAGQYKPSGRARQVVLWALGLIAAAGVFVLAARGVTTLPGVPEWLARYPGEYAPAVEATPGFPAWARWSHFLNFFFMALIVRSGLLVRTQQKPPAFWTPRAGGKKVSIYLWLHTSLDVLWVVNGLAFVVLLFVSGHWARIVPTSWEVIPNAASAALQYATLDWPTDDGWVNYNSLQQLMYFAVVFIAAPLAVISGVRMSEWWSDKWERINRAYPAPVARAVHFPVMLFFVLFVIAHVTLVLATGALRNLNHMFAGSDAINWVGFTWFVIGVLVTAGAVAAARPLVLAPIAGLFGRVSNR
ncbi:cytochrome b/b6 domain-containing protein [Leucobacter sp. HY1908]